MAADRAAAREIGRGRVRAARAAHDLPRVRAARRPRAGSIRGWPPTWRRWPTPTGWPARTRRPRAGPGRSRTRRTASGRTDLFATIDTDGRTGDRRSDFDDVYGDWYEVARTHDAPTDTPRRTCPTRSPRRSWPVSSWPREDPAALLLPRHEDEAMALFNADGPALDELARIADDLRKEVNGDDITYVVNRNINFSNVCYVGCRFCAFAQREQDADAYRLSRRAGRRPGRAGLAGRRLRGLHAGRHRPEDAGHRVRRPGARDQAAGAGDARARVLADGDRHRRRQGRRVGPRLADRAARGRPRHHPGHRRRDPRRRRALGADQGQAAGGDLGRGGHHGAPGWASGPARP